MLRRDLIDQVDLHGRVLRGDANYDSSRNYAAVAGAGGRLVAPRRKPHTRLGHRRHHPDRLAAVAQLERTAPPDGLRDHKRRRIRVEQVLAHLANLPSVGLWGLPAFVRRLGRVRRWVAAKIVLYHLYKVLRQRERPVHCAA